MCFGGVSFMGYVLNLTDRLDVILVSCEKCDCFDPFFCASDGCKFVFSFVWWMGK